jgi:adhesin/invasin
MVQVHYQSALSNVSMVHVASAAPGLFALAGGRGQGVILNSDLSPNSIARPAARGSEIVLYATGEGLTTPAIPEGQLAQAPLPAPVQSVVVRIGGVAAQVRFAGLAPGFAGLLQINVIVPSVAPTGGAVPVELTIGGVPAQSGVTVAIN